MLLQRMKEYFYVFFPLLTVGCVGPTTPFGAIDDLLPKSTEMPDGKEAAKSSPVKISFKPKHQVLHDKNDFIVEIKDKTKIPDLKDVKLIYNSIDVTDKFLAHSEVKKSIKDQSLQLTFNNLRLKTGIDSDIRIFYSSGKGTYASLFTAPTCDFFEKRDVHAVKGFRPPDEYLIWLHDISRNNRLNASLLAGVVAQESGFNPKAVSWAKALGLTQITPLAEEQIMTNQKSWPRRDIASLSYVELKTKVLTGEINEETDWRLSPKYSIQGGAEYMKYLHSYWEDSENRKLLKSLHGDSGTNFSKVILASYNSGPARVKNVLQNKGDRWLEDENLKEARRYIRLVFSYCYHFSERTRDDS